MINLLPPEYSSNIRYGRANTVLRRWIIGVLVAIAGLIIIIEGGLIYIDRQSQSLRKDVNNSNAQLKAQNLEGVKKDATEISGDIITINKVLGQEVDFAGLIKDIGKAMPSGTILSALTVSKVNGALDLNTKATDYASAAQIAVNLSDPKNSLFNRVDIININCNNNPSAYKCTATFRALFAKNTANHYLNVATNGGSNGQ